ncbi:MAG: hypothetical protein IPL78_18055 [Chloroflexi bacterium]|nr:hypothetical protein [Chloroflexota bacterium]
MRRLPSAPLSPEHPLAWWETRQAAQRIFGRGDGPVVRRGAGGRSHPETAIALAQTL